MEELLRHDGPLQPAIPAVAAAPVEVGGVTVAPGEIVVISLLAANRDPRRDPAAADLDVTRRPSSHLAFGHGIHHCLGAPLARVEGRIALSGLLARFPELHLAPGGLTRTPGLLMNGYAALPVVLRRPVRR